MPVSFFKDEATDGRSLTTDINMMTKLCCSACGNTTVTLHRVRDNKNKKVKPARYICSECSRLGLDK